MADPEGLRGLKVMVAADFFQEWRGSAWTEGLRQLGVETAEYNWSVDHSEGTAGYLERRVLLGPGIGRINRRIMECVAEEAPNVLLIYAGRLIWPETIKALSKLCVVAGYDNDDPFGRWGLQPYFRHYRGGLGNYSCHHVFRELNVAEYQRAGCARVKLLRSFYLPWIHKPIPPSEDDRRNTPYEVVFVGNGQPGSRVEHVTALARAGVRVQIRGEPRYWHRYLPKDVIRRLPPIRPARGADYARIIAKAPVSLAFFSDGNRDQYTVRAFEIPACGGFMLAQRTPVMQWLFEEGQEAEYFSTSSELIAKIRHYLVNDDARRKVASAGRRRCVADGHDVVNRMRQWLADLRGWGLLPS